MTLGQGLVIAYPVAYFTARYGGRRKGLFLVLLIAPFWISYMMRMLAWVNLLGWSASGIRDLADQIRRETLPRPSYSRTRGSRTA